MFKYYTSLAWRSLRRNWIMSTLMVLALAIGIGASMTMLTVLHVMTGDPLPIRSAHLYRPYLNPLPLRFSPKPGSLGVAKALTWPDAKALLHAHRAPRQAAMARGYLVARSTQSGVHPETVVGSFTTRDFFAMFGVTFLAGHAWSEQADANQTPVVVLTRKLSARLFGTTDAVGKTAYLGKHAFRVIGVVQNWHPDPLFYALNVSFGASDQFFMPLSTAMAMHLSVNDMNSWSTTNSGSLTSSTTGWLSFWVQLNTSSQVAAYRRFLFNYSASQKTLGRFQRPPNDAHLYSLMQWLHKEGLVPGDVMLQTWLALGFLFVCMINIIALLLAKFTRRRNEISVRRALGAKRRDIFMQFGIESALVGMVGGLIGIGIAELGLWSIRHQPDDYAHLAHMDGGMLAATVIFAVFISILAGLLPAWRACHIAPATQLKTL